MPDFRYTPKLGGDNAPPNQCAFCSTHVCDEGFVDLLVSFVPYGRLYACARCLWSASRLVGCADPQQVEQRKTEVEELLDVNAQLREELDVEQASKVVPLADVLEHLRTGKPKPKVRS